jgi:hypothetical protein
MRTVTWGTAAVVLAAQALVMAQGKGAAQVLADARRAMGGDKLAAVKALTATGRTQRTLPNGNTMESEFELALELPDKYLLRSVLVAMGSMSVYRNSGFNGGQVIEEIDRPPNLAGATMMIRVAGPGGQPADPEKMTPEQRAAYDQSRLLANRKDFGRLALGLFGASPAAYPLEFTYAGVAESADGQAEVLDVKGEGGLSARLFVHSETHLPLMLSWMDKEPLVMQMGGPGGGGNVAFGPGGGTARVVQAGPGGPGGMSREEREKFEADLDARRQEAEAKLRTVEYRLYYADYQDVGGVLLPHRVQRAVDGKTTEEMVFEGFKINPKIEAKKFQPIK